MREQQEQHRLLAENEVAEAESKLPDLEAQEMVCLQRLQNSRIVTQSVLEELESSLGAKSSVTTLLRQKQRGQEHLDASACPLNKSLDEEDDNEPLKDSPLAAPLRGNFVGALG